jgi:hypothetical protein
MSNLRSFIAPYYRNLKGWRTKRKIVVFESDDWGSIRMPSREVYEKCLKAGYPVDRNPYEKFDSLESNNDLELLFEILSKFTDQQGNHPIITANCLVANPDFARIKESGYQSYFYERVTETFKRTPSTDRGFDLWQEGQAKGVFRMQFHGREHLNVGLFMRALQEKNADVLFAFDMGMPGIMLKSNGDIGNYFVEATHFKTHEDKAEILAAILDGLDIFEELMGFKSASLIPPNYTWSNDFNEAVGQKGVKYFQGYSKIREPQMNGKAPIKHSYFLGQQNIIGQLNLIRNASFEPTLSKVPTLAMNNCLHDVSAAFAMGKPAIVSTHRINYMGSIFPSNRDDNLKLLKKLLDILLLKWPDIEFMASDTVGNLIYSNK